MTAGQFGHQLFFTIADESRQSKGVRDLLEQSLMKEQQVF